MGVHSGSGLLHADFSGCDIPIILLLFGLKDTLPSSGLHLLCVILVGVGAAVRTLLVMH